MKTIGLLGGMSWESTQAYYKGINEEVRTRLGGLHSAPSILYSVDFALIESWQRNGQWTEAGQYLASIAQKLEEAGVDGIALCTNTMHKVAPYIEAAIHVPFLHVAETTASKIKQQNHKNILLLGTKYTMEQPFLIDCFKHKGLNVFVPDETDREDVNRIIFDELCLGNVRESSQQKLSTLINEWNKRIDGVILGCTELGMAVTQNNVQPIVYDTTKLHIEAIVDFILQLNTSNKM